MGKMGFFSLALFVAFFAIFASPVLSRTFPLTSKAALLDVASTLSKTQDLFSLNSQNVLPSKHQVRHRHPPVSPDSSLIFELHPRLSVRGTSERDYGTLTLARLARDSARVKAIQTRLDLVSLDIKKADLTPLEVEFEEQKLEGPVISGTSQGSGEYFCRVGVGNRRLKLTWCSTPGVTSTGCNAHPARNVTSKRTLSSTRPSAAGITTRGCFVGAAGLIGLGGGPLSFPSQINASSFSYCLVDRDSDSASTLEFNSVPSPDAVTAPLVRNSKLDTFYYVDLTGISVAGELLPIPPSTFQLNDNGNGGVIVDSGTAVTRLQTEAYNSMRDAFKKGTKDLPSANDVALFDTCYDLSSRKSVEVPTVAFHFGNGKELSLPAKNYMIPVDSSGTFCFAFAPTSSSLGIIGNVQQQGTRVSYDLTNSLIGFSPNKC
ncbi:UNVERIFIED_CONTAM: protein ASPARTIC PROTEASE IN GUARD CELL 1 [Sesamum angustifolium]|uniref:Protein ASPARTIC PROTEASE IN GUARD CELL 1 n=1 Tax=Sesamum angustifolium TaxID=2727405 RepID=A0AAW2RKY7_9LAMI